MFLDLITDTLEKISNFWNTYHTYIFSISLGLLQTGTKIVDLSEVKDRKSLVALLKQLHREYRSHTHSPKTSLIIDGKGVSAIMKSIHLKRRLADISSKLRTVVACRLSPVQKSQLVRMIKLSNKGALDDDDR